MYGILGIFIFVLLAVISIVFHLFTSQIILLESGIFAIITGLLMKYYFNIHPAFCLLIGLAVFVIMFFVQNTKYGFWIIGGIMSLLWGGLIALRVYDGTNGDNIWTYTAWGLTTLLVMGFHINSRLRKASNSTADSMADSMADARQNQSQGNLRETVNTYNYLKRNGFIK